MNMKYDATLEQICHAWLRLRLPGHQRNANDACVPTGGRIVQCADRWQWLFVWTTTPLATAIRFSKFFIKNFVEGYAGYLRCVRRRMGRGLEKKPSNEMPESNDPPELAAFVVPCCSHKNAGLGWCRRVSVNG